MASRFPSHRSILTLIMSGAILMLGALSFAPSAHAAALELHGTPLFSDPDIVSYYRLEGNSNDAVGTNNGGDTSITYSSGNGQFAQGAGFNGSTSGIVISDNAGLRLTTWTVSAWVKTSSIGSNPTGYEKIVYKGNSSSDEPISLYLYYGKPVLEAYKTGSYDNYALDTNTIDDGQWHYLVGVRKLGVDMELYVDGVLVGSGSDNGGTSSNTSNVTIGERTDGDSTMNGSIDDVAIFSRALSADEIAYLYSGPFSLLNQYRSDATTTIDEGAITTDNNVVFGATVSSDGTSTLQMQVEVEPAGSNNFTGVPNATSTFVSQGNYASATYSLNPELSANGNYHWQARVLDANNNSTTWQIFGPQTTSTDFTVQTVPLFTQIGSPYPSLASTSVVDGGWAGDTYDDGTIFCGGGNTIGYCGCAITSVAMDLRYFGIATDTSGDPVDPRTLNVWLTNNFGYDSVGNLEWGAVTGYASSTTGGDIVLDSNSGTGYGSTLSAMRPYLDPLLASSTPIPVILTETVNSHFVVAAGITQNNGTSTYAIRDSAWYLTNSLNQATSTDTSSTIYGYANSANGVHVYYDPPHAPALNEYHVGLPNTLMLVDAQGRRTGKDPATGIFYHEIPGTSYSEIGTPTSSPQGAGELLVSNPPDGKYKLYILGARTGQYWFDLRVDDRHTHPKLQKFNGDIQAGAMIAYDESYDSKHWSNSSLGAGNVVSSTATIFTAPRHDLPPPVLPPALDIPTKTTPSVATHAPQPISATFLSTIASEPTSSSSTVNSTSTASSTHE